MTGGPSVGAAAGADEQQASEAAAAVAAKACENLPSADHA
jgi:hypothetical protein